MSAFPNDEDPSMQAQPHSMSVYRRTLSMLSRVPIVGRCWAGGVFGGGYQAVDDDMEAGGHGDVGAGHVGRYISLANSDNLSQLAREELLHFEQVVGLMRERGIRYDHLSPSRYAGALRAEVSTSEPRRLVDTLIVGALIEARSCERFAALAPRVDPELGRYYRYLLKSESRHFEDYLDLARRYADEPIDDRIAFFKEKERGLIESPDSEFRFHSGTPEAGNS